MHLQSPVNMKPSTLSSSELPSHFISRVQSHIQQSLPRIPSNFTSTPFHRQPPRSAHFSILIFSLLPHMVAGLLLPGSSEVTVECRMRRCCKTPLPQGLTLTLSWKPTGKGRRRRMKARAEERKREAPLAPRPSPRRSQASAFHPGSQTFLTQISVQPRSWKGSLPPKLLNKPIQ